MTEPEKNNIPIPTPATGTQKNIEDSRILPSVEKAKFFYKNAKRKMLDVNRWKELCGNSGSAFELTDETGHTIKGSPRKGNYFKIDIPGPGSVAGDGFDWVRVEAVEETSDVASDTEYTIIRVRPASDPTSVDNTIAHFFSDTSTSNFLVSREGVKVTAAVLGRNEITNTHRNNGWLNKLRNFIVGIGAKLGLANPQWKSLVKGILNT